MRYNIKVIPNAKRPEVIFVDKQNLKVKVDAQPEDGKANERLIEILADRFVIRKSAVVLLNGARSRNKTVELEYK